MFSGKIEVVSDDVIAILGRPRRCYKVNSSVMVCGANLNELELLKFNDIPEGVRIVVDTRRGLGKHEHLYARIPTLIDKIILDKFSFKIRFWLPQPYVLGDPLGFYRDLFKTLASEAERLGFETYLNLSLHDVRPRLYELTIIKILSPSERRSNITTVISGSIKLLSDRVSKWIEALKDIR